MINNNAGNHATIKGFSSKVPCFTFERNAVMQLAQSSCATRNLHSKLVANVCRFFIEVI